MAALDSLRRDLPSLHEIELAHLARFDEPAHVGLWPDDEDHLRAVAELARGEIRRRADEAARAHLRPL